MPEKREPADRTREPAQAIELCLLVELEARWENMRKAPPQSREVGSVTTDLRDIQKAYDAFRSKLVAYNEQYTPAHIPELLLNTPPRLGRWCRALSELYLEVEHDPKAHCPIHLLEKAYRSAQRLSARLNKSGVGPSAPPGTLRAAIESLGALVQWCADLAGGGASE